MQPYILQKFVDFPVAPLGTKSTYLVLILLAVENFLPLSQVVMVWSEAKYCLPSVRMMLLLPQVRDGCSLQPQHWFGSGVVSILNSLTSRSGDVCHTLTSTAWKEDTVGRERGSPRVRSVFLVKKYQHLFDSVSLSADRRAVRLAGCQSIFHGSLIPLGLGVLKLITHLALN